MAKKKKKTTKRTTRKRTYKKRAEKKSPSFYLGVFSVLVIIVVSIYSPIRSFHLPSTISALEVPKLPDIYLPAPLELPPYSTTILGLQKFDAKDIIAFVNKERKERNLSPLRLNEELSRAAQMRAAVILKHENFSHHDPYDDIELVTVLPKVGYKYKYATENIGMGGVSGESFVEGFMNSKSHRDNLLDPYLSDTGAAVVTGPYKQYYVNIAVQLFAIPGGKEEYLGYDKNDREKYRKMIADIDAKLNPILWTFNSIMGKPGYSDENKQELVVQKEILEEVYDVMLEGEPLTSNHVAMIMEFNELL